MCRRTGDITLKLSSTKVSVAQPTVPELNVPAGTSVLAFEVSTSAVAVSTSATIKASANGTAKSKKLVVNP
jgi:hypothetical protein